MSQNAATAERIDVSKLSVVVGQLGAFGGDEIERNLEILGIRKPRISHDYDRICRAIDADRADVLVCDTTANKVRAQDLLRGVRNQEIGSNPFLVTIALTQPKNTHELVETIDTGPDDIFVGGFSRDVFVRRVNELAFNRKKFVATSSYVGPTRRGAARPGQKTAEEFAVPNPVYATGTGMPKDELWAEIADAARALHLRKLGSDVEAIRDLVGEIMPDYQVSHITDEFRHRTELLLTTVGNVHRRALRLGYGSLVTLCDLAENVVGEVKERPKPPNLKHMRAMPKLVAGFEAALASAPDTIAAA